MSTRKKIGFRTGSRSIARVIRSGMAPASSTTPLMGAKIMRESRAWRGAKSNDGTRKNSGLRLLVEIRHTRITGSRGGGYVVWFTVGCQSFQINPYRCDRKCEAQWWQKMLVTALTNFYETIHQEVA